MSVTIPALVAILLAAFVAAALLRARPGTLDISKKNLVILAAHPDDCVIAGGELAHAILARGGEVRVAYLTCGSDDPDDARSAARRAEALAAWGSVGVGSDNLEFLAARQSPISGPQVNGGAAAYALARKLAAVLKSAPEDAHVVFPAAGETHPDHRLLRRLAFEALRETGRGDLVPLEVPEYNRLVTFRQTPVLTLSEIGRGIPGIGRFVPRAGEPASFPKGAIGCIVDDPSAHASKIAQFDAFTSENPALLKQHFGGQARYRIADLSVDPEDLGWRLNLNGRLLDAGAVAVVALVSLLLLASTMWLAGKAPSSWAFALAVVSAGLAVFAVRRGRHIFAAMLAGVLAGSLASFALS